MKTRMYLRGFAAAFLAAVVVAAGFGSGAVRADDFHLTIEEAQENANKIYGRSLLLPDGTMLCDSENLTQWSKALAAGDIKTIVGSNYIDQDNHAHHQMNFTMYDDAEIAWLGSTIGAAVTMDHKLIIDNNFNDLIPEINDAVMADERDRMVAVLHTDGTVTVHSRETGADPAKYDWNFDLSCLTDIVQMQMEVMFPSNDGEDMIPVIIGLKSDGTMVSTAGYPEEISEWTDIVGFMLDDGGIIGWRGDGTLVACGRYIFNDSELENIEKFQHIRYFNTGRSGLSAVSDDGYALGEIRFAYTHVAPDGSYDSSEYAPIPSYKEWLEENN